MKGIPEFLSKTQMMLLSHWNNLSNDSCKTNFLVLEVSPSLLQDAAHLCLLAWEKFRIFSEPLSKASQTQPFSTSGFLIIPSLSWFSQHLPSCSLGPQSSGCQCPSDSKWLFLGGVWPEPWTMSTMSLAHEHQACFKYNLKTHLYCIHHFTTWSYFKCNQPNCRHFLKPALYHLVLWSFLFLYVFFF